MSKYLVMWATDHPAPVTIATGSSVPFRLIRSGSSFGISVLWPPLPGSGWAGQGARARRWSAEASPLTWTRGLWKAAGRVSGTVGGSPWPGAGGDVRSHRSLCLSRCPALWLALAPPSQLPEALRRHQPRRFRGAWREAAGGAPGHALTRRSRSEPYSVAYFPGRWPRPHAAWTRCSDRGFLP